jgi:hypothetical protein
MPDANIPQVFHGTAVISTLDGVTTVLVAFLFVCLIFPSIVRNKTQYYAALAVVIVVLLLHTLQLMLNKSDGFVVPAGVFTGLLQIVALVLLVLSVGGLTARQLAGDMARAYEVIRRGETEKEVIIPIGGGGGGGGGGRTGRTAADEPPRTVYHIDSGQTPERNESPAAGSPGATIQGGERDDGIPLSDGR